MSSIIPSTNDKTLSSKMKEYVEATNDAANRSRYVFIILIISTILIFVGLNNSYMNSWMVDDLREVYKPGNAYISELLEKKLTGNKEGTADYFRSPCDDPKDTNPRCVSPAEKAKTDAQEALMKLHMESRLLIRIPILGVSLHVNDLGLVGGLTLIVLLLLTRTSLSREIKNLNYSFKKAFEEGELDEFYDSLSMRQLFTVPHMKGEKRNHFLSKAPYAACLFPAIVYLSLVEYDIFTIFVLPRYRIPFEHKTILYVLRHPLSESSISWLILVEGICALVICFIAIRCVERQHYIYSIWDNYWKLLKPVPELCLLEPDVADKLEESTDYSIVRDNNGVAQAMLNENILTELTTINRFRIQPGNLYLFRWLWRALKEETKPIFHFLPHIIGLLFKKHKAEKPLVITITPELAELFSNDKEINETLLEILTRREKERRSPAVA